MSTILTNVTVTTASNAPARPAGLRWHTRLVRGLAAFWRGFASVRVVPMADPAALRRDPEGRRMLVGGKVIETPWPMGTGGEKRWSSISSGRL